MTDSDTAQIATMPLRSGPGRPGTPSAVHSTVAVTLGYTGLVLSVVSMTYLHLVASAQLSPVQTVLSDYVFADGIGWMFAVSAVGLALGGVGALLGLAGSELSGPPVLRVGLWLVPVGSLLVALFPTDLAGPISVSAEVHRYAAGAVLVSLPTVGYLTSRPLETGRFAGYGAWLRRFSVLSMVALALFLLSHLGPSSESVPDVRGVAQRLLLVLELLVLGQLIYLPARLASRQ